MGWRGLVLGCRVYGGMCNRLKDWVVKGVKGLALYYRRPL